MSDCPDTYPTTLDILAMMAELGYKWSNEALVYCNPEVREIYMSSEAAEHLYKYLIGDRPYRPLKETKANAEQVFVVKVSHNVKIEEYEIPAWLSRLFFEVGKRLGHLKKGQHAK